MNQPSPVRRPTCPRCLRPQRACLCPWVRPVAPAVEVLILQHPLEQDHAKGSARLLHLSLTGSRLVVGETFAGDELHDLLRAPFIERETSDEPAQPVLLYPDPPDGAPRSAITTPLPEQAGRLRLVVLDGTWRKSRKMLYLNPLLQALPRLPLRDPPASRYTIRKAHKEDQLSTLEATCHALMQLECDRQKYLPLLDAFDGFVARKIP